MQTKSWLADNSKRIGLITSVDGTQLIALMLDPSAGTADCWQTPVTDNQFPSLTPQIPQCHWFERAIWDLFGLHPDGHPRLKHLLLHEQYDTEFLPLRVAHPTAESMFANPRKYEFMKVKGPGVYEIPVGPVHAGIIEPGHFRLSCLGEIILNLEIRLGYTHRGIERRLLEIEWRKARFLAESAGSDTIIGNALAHAEAIESLCAVETSTRAKYLRSIALEIERVGMHIADIGGMATDIGFLAIASSLARMRGKALRLAEMLSGSRFQRGFILPGGVSRDPDRHLGAIRTECRQLRFLLEPILSMLIENPVVQERLDNVGRISPSLAHEFGLVGVTARACGIRYDTREYFSHGIYPRLSIPVALETHGDALSRLKVRLNELYYSIELIYGLLGSIPPGEVKIDFPQTLAKDAIGVGIVEAFRGELIHLILTDQHGKLKRYAIKDPSFNNWTGLAIAARNNLVADFPICNKSFSLSYSGHDL